MLATPRRKKADKTIIHDPKVTKTKKPSKLQEGFFSAPTWARTRDQKIMSLLL